MQDTVPGDCHCSPKLQMPMNFNSRDVMNSQSTLLTHILLFILTSLFVPWTMWIHHGVKYASADTQSYLSSFIYLSPVFELEEKTNPKHLQNKIFKTLFILYQFVF